VRLPRALALALLPGLPAALVAQQVGTAPERSPFQDILTKQGFTVFAGRFAGNANAAHTGARPGFILGGRLDVRVSGAMTVSATVGEVWTSRLQINAGGTVSDTAHDMGNLDVRLVSADLGLQLNLTGDKTWHRLAPYVALGAGLTTPTSNVVDPGGFALGTDFTVVPSIGTRFFISRNFALRLEARSYYYRYTFPLAYFDRPYAGHANYAPVLAQTVGDREWYQNFTVWVGLTYGFVF
jgi:hypothetical protein